ncbi:hypothetical protein Rhopal_005367-T1 [Rhodotorula paludigena]|uniref:Proteophosphoglycan ppg4 n=1 Tax=Rhodotorula paludigena TaxID=86838 RepID=A0AAV5GSJ5_9BASI|nr:hypothetical protein Rhopal_005367-T1 [Rhodotorula paludigena]
MSRLLKPVSSRASTASDRPPSYQTYDAPPSPPPLDDRPPPFDDFPASHAVGGGCNVLFTTVDELKDHLRLLGAFRQLKGAVEAGAGREPGVLDKLDAKARWAVFVHVAVWRFECFLVGFAAHQLRLIVPPLDVALVLHAYLLNPLRFEEDRARGIDAVSLKQQVPSRKDATRWQQASGLPYDPLESFAVTKGRPLPLLPAIPKEFVPWVTPEGTGYAQQGFCLATSNLRLPIVTHETLGVARLVQDIWLSQFEHEQTLAGSVSSADTVPELPTHSKRALYVRIQLRKEWVVQKSDEAADLGNRLEWSMLNAREMVQHALKKRPRGANAVLRCYTRGEPFSLDLAMAVIRQGSFIDKMHDLGWTTPGRFDTDDSLLKRSVARYHAFMDLMSSAPTSFFDLAWHTHQLKETYKGDTVTCTRRFIDHDDKVEENALANGFDVTARAWESRFGVPYSTCGCPLPSAAPVSRLARTLGLTSSSSRATFPSGALTPLSPSAADAEASHPSEHNALQLPLHPHSAKRRAARLAELEARRRRTEREERKKREKKGVERDPEGAERAHQYAFLMPFPLVPGPYGPAGYPLAPGGCAATDAHRTSGR